MLLIFLGSLALIGSDDTFMNLVLGRHLFADGTLPEVEPYLFTMPGFHWHVWHEWLAYAYYFGLYELGGFTVIIVVRALWLTLLAYFFWRFGRASGNIPPLALGAAMLATFIVAFERCRTDRASFFGDMLIASLILMLLSFQSGRWPGRLKWLLPPMFVVWINVHPSFPLGWILLAGYIIFGFSDWSGLERKSWLLVFAASVLATAVNPLGIKGILFPFTVIGDSGEWKQINSEWVPLFTGDIFEIGVKLRAGVFLAVGLAINAWGLRKRRWFAFFGTVTLAYLCSSSVRFVSIAAFGIGAFTIYQMSGWAWPRRKLEMAMPAVAYAVLSWAILFARPSAGAYWAPLVWQGGVFLPNIPIQAVRFMASLPPGNIFNEYATGGLLAWELKGRMKIAGHGHIDKPELAVNNYWRFSRSPRDFREIVGGGRVEYFLVLRSQINATPDSGWVQELNKYWLTVYEDDAALVFKRIHSY